MFRSTSLRGSLPALGLAAALAAAAPAQQTPAGTLFPQPFRVEHHLVQSEADGTVFLSDPVVDTYGGSWIVSERPDGSRLVLDLARREATEIRPDRGTYWTVSLDSLGELQRRLATVQGLGGSGAQGTEGGTGSLGRRDGSSPAEESAPVDSFHVEELPRLASRRGGSPDEPWARASSQRLRVVARQDAAEPEAGMEVWVDPTIRLGAAAIAALEELEGRTLAPAGTEETPPGRLLAAARRHAAGALPVRTSRPLGRAEAGRYPGRLEDVATRAELLDAFPAEAVVIPEGFRRVPHPLEAAVRFLEEDEERNRLLSGRGEGE